MIPRNDMNQRELKEARQKYLRDGLERAGMNSPGAYDMLRFFREKQKKRKEAHE